MRAFEADYGDRQLVGLPNEIPADARAWFWVVHTQLDVGEFLATDRAANCLQSGGGILIVSRGGGYAGWTAEALRAELASLDERLQPRVHVLPDRFVGETVERVKLFVERVVPGLEPHADIPWQELDRTPAPDALVAYYLLGLLGEEATAERCRVRPLAEAEYIAILGRQFEATVESERSIDPATIDDQERLGDFLRGLREDL